MKYFSHRRNTIDELKSTPHKYGVEIDIRSTSGRLTLHHDPFALGVGFEEWLTHYQHSGLILNVKEEGLEKWVLELMLKFNISNYFFLDQSFPFLVKTAKQGETRCAARLSEFESIDTVLSLKGKIQWVWVDCFTQFSLNAIQYSALKSAGMNVCFVSPELQGRDPLAEIPLFAQKIQAIGATSESVCTKRMDLWEEQLGGK